MDHGSSPGDGSHQLLTPISWVQDGIHLWIAPLEAIDGHVVVTSSQSQRWAVVRLSDRDWTDMAAFRQAVERAVPDLLTLKSVRRILDDPVGIAPPSIRSVLLQLTEECDLRCRHCFYLGDQRTAPRRLSVHQVESMLDQAIPLGLKRVTLSGGEPLLHPEFDRILGLLEPRGLDGIVLTNGIGLDHARCQRLSAAGCSVLVSIHGPNAEIHERLSGAGTFSGAVRGTELLLRYMPAEKVTINCTLSEWNLDHIEPMIAMTATLGAGRIRFMPLHRPKARNGERPALDYRSKKLENWARIASEGLVRRRWPVDVSFGFTGLPGSSCEEMELAGQPPCEVGRKLVVTADGGIYPCALLMSSEFLLGRLEDGLAMVISSLAFTNLVATLHSRHRTVPRCQGCALGGICRGGCPALALQTSGDFNQPDPLCESNLAFSANYFSLVTRAMTAAD